MTGLADKGLTVTISGMVKPEEVDEALVTLGGLMQTALGEWGVDHDERQIEEKTIPFYVDGGGLTPETFVSVRAEVVW